MTGTKKIKALAGLSTVFLAVMCAVCPVPLCADVDPAGDYTGAIEHGSGFVA